MKIMVQLSALTNRVISLRMDSETFADEVILKNMHDALSNEGHILIKTVCEGKVVRHRLSGITENE